MIKLVSLYMHSFKVAVSKNLSMMANEDLLYSVRRETYRHSQYIGNVKDIEVVEELNTSRDLEHIDRTSKCQIILPS